MHISCIVPSSSRHRAILGSSLALALGSTLKTTLHLESERVNDTSSLLVQISAFNSNIAPAKEESILESDSIYIARYSSSVESSQHDTFIIPRRYHSHIHPYGLSDDHHKPSTPYHHVALSPEPPQPRSLVFLCQRCIRGPRLADYSAKSSDVVQYEPGLARERLDDAARRTISTV